jgi:hypothetical protein
MTLRGQFKNGVVVLEDSSGLREGEVVNVRPAVRRATKKTVAKKRAKTGRKKSSRTLIDRLGTFVASFDGPSDLAAQHDHYAHGRPKRK